MSNEREPKPTIASPEPDPIAETEASVNANASVETIVDGGHSANVPESYGVRVGSIIAGRYELESELDSGGFGVVFLARDKQLLDKLVVVKVLHAKMLENDYVLQKFRQEVEALTRLDHPGIVSVLDTGTVLDGNPFIVMQYIEGKSLRRVLPREGMDLERAAHIIRGVGRALTFAHDKGILHRDLKPENIMLQKLANDEQPKIIDFGIARVKDSQIAPETATDVSMGTVSYMSPEQLNRQPLGPASDIYSLGIIAYEMVTGRHPFNPETVYQMIDLQRAGLRVRATALRPSLPREAETAIQRALNFDPNSRYERARDFGDAVADALTSPGFRRIPLADEEETLSRVDVAEETAPTVVDTEETIRRTGRGSSSRAKAVTQATVEQTQPGTRRKFNPLLIALPVLALAIGVVAIWYTLRPNSLSTEQQSATPVNVNAPERELSYSLTLQRMANGQSLGKPKQATGQEMYDNGDQFWMSLTSPQDGYLYIVNEGSQPRDGLPSYNALFPLDNGSAAVAANQTIETPSRNGNGYFFDEKEGMEKMWIVFSKNPVAELEAAKNAANTQRMGEVQDTSVVRGLQDFFSRNGGASVKAERDDFRERTQLKGKGDVIVYQAQLKHH